MNTEYGRIWDWKSHEDSPLRWRNPCVARLKGDPFEGTPFEVLDRVFAVMVLRPDVTFQLLTKRPERMREYIAEGPFGAAERVWGKWDASAHHAEAPEWPGWPLPNVWLGVSVENQQWADVRLPELLGTPAAVRFVSCEPLLGPLELERLLHDSDCISINERYPYDQMCYCNEPPKYHLGWVIVGGESGPGARPCDIGWIRSIVGQCKVAGTAVFVKQVGAAPTSWCVDSLLDPGYEFEPDFCDVWEASEGPRCEGRCRMLRDRKGGIMDEWPQDLRIREMPTSAVNNGSR